MHKELITYTDYNGVTRTEPFWFHMSKAELAEKNLSIKGGMKGMVEKIIKTQDTPGLVKIFKDLILQAYGEKSEDGRRFIKSPELSKAFSETEAYSELFMKLATDDVAAANWLAGIVPDDYRGDVQKAVEEASKEPPVTEAAAPKLLS